MSEYTVTENPDNPFSEPKPQELIRCKDCVFWDKSNNNIMRNCQMLGVCCSSDYYCANAIRGKLYE